MAVNYIKNLEAGKALKLEALVQYSQGQIVSRTLAQNKAVSLTLFAFWQGEEISSHDSKGDALISVLDGEGEITIGDQTHMVKKGESILMPAEIPHAVKAVTNFKMYLTVVFPDQ
ncbi:MAG: cupin domain-containing protein [Candidatus Cloacimonetes bacterium]|nr:cupin domain-containing protein [Candidatus Cloacimonadota bacterium]HNZ07434.1 cupin domain-containing protein [Candidatus Cloacimonadota bacterium]HOH79196.1 cupin domain-containing protein [Candidatus Cloacimonadota bacterium]